MPGLSAHTWHIRGPRIASVFETVDQKRHLDVSAKDLRRVAKATAFLEQYTE
jgi:hypothetical protein